MLVYILFVTGEGWDSEFKSVVPIRAILSTTSYNSHVRDRISYIERGYMVSTKTREMTHEQWNSVGDIS